MADFFINSEESYQHNYNESITNPDKFWSDIANNFSWIKKWDNVVDWNFENYNVKWFNGAQLNITINCLDRHLINHPNKTALIWEANNPEEKSIRYSYAELHKKVCKYANVLKNNGAKKGDRIAIYMPMIPDLLIATLACARIGAIHSIIFAGFSAHALADRINDAEANILLTSSGMYRGEKTINIKEIIDEALLNTKTVNKVIISKRTDLQIQITPNRDVWLEDEIKKVDDICQPEIMDAEDPLFILYTSGSTGKPKGVVHTCGGYMVYTGYTFKNVFQYNNNDVYWCTADIGWITGHSYIIYGPLLNSATTLMFEGVPSWPDFGRFWQICDKHQVNQFYTAPTAIRALMTHGKEFVNPYKLNSLKIIGSVGEPINKEAWVWYNNNIGKNNCPIVDTWWQTETGGIMISSLGDIGPQKPSYAGRPLPGVQPVLINQDGQEIKENNKEGYLCIKYPWPSIIRTTYGDHQRCINTYFSHYKGYYFTGDGAKRDENGNYRIIGRVDDVINVSGHRFGTAEIENAINSNNNIAESAVVGCPHEIKGQGIYAYVICKNKIADETILKSEIINTVSEEIGKIAKPDKIQIVSGLPKTRSGKIMRRILRKVAEGDTSNLGDTSTLLDPNIVNEIINGSIK